ncbi:MAG: hypothetical protein HUU46_24750 [Candidatus Hydrogenedentes bacterium]|nr:hypothetical protein [Candidatus Hydrogenedentota bacterium]
METAASNSSFRVFTYRSRKRTVRFLVSPGVVDRISFIEELLMRAAAGGGEADKLIWPDGIVVSSEGELLSAPDDNLHVVVPNWLFDRVKEEQKHRLPLYFRICGDVTTRELYWDFAYVLGHYLAPLQTDKGLRKDCHVLINCGLFFPIEYRPVRTYFAIILVLPFFIAALGIVYCGSAVWWNNRKLLYAKAKLDRCFGRRRALAKAKQRLLKLGEPPEKLAKLVIPQDLRVIENDCDRAKLE